MGDYLPIKIAMIFMVVLLALMAKVLVIYNKYVLIRVGKLKAPYRLTWTEFKKNRSYFWGADIKARVRGLSVSPKIFSKDQDGEVLAVLARSFRRGLFAVGTSFGIVLVGVVVSNGQPLPVIIGSFVALTFALWSLIKI